jgi:SagB-type dehydrogenase family enzyme
LLVDDVQGLRPGPYRFVATEHKLADKITLALWSGNRTQVKRSAVTFLWAAVACRMTWRYGVRGYRHLLVDAGHVCQNLYLAAEAIGAGVCAIATFIDDDLNELIGSDGKEQFAVYLATVGKKQGLTDKEAADELEED